MNTSSARARADALRIEQRRAGASPTKSRSIGVTNENGLHTASVFFLAGTASDERAERMNAFWKKLIEFQDRDTIVVALAVGSG